MTPIAWISVQLFLHKKCYELLKVEPLVICAFNKVFIEDLYAGMELTESDWSRDFEVEDPDLSTDRINYEVVQGSLMVSDPSLEGIEDPFTANANG